MHCAHQTHDHANALLGRDHASDYENAMGLQESELGQFDGVVSLAASVGMQIYYLTLLTRRSQCVHGRQRRQAQAFLRTCQDL